MTTYYGTLTDAEAYFSRRLHVFAWDEAVISDREKAMYMATRAINRLNFAGEVAVAGQELQFPRGDDTEVPADICEACYEEVLLLLDGLDADEESSAIGVVSEALSGVRTTYDVHRAPEHVVAGILSAKAWKLLRPYLRDDRTISLSRGS